MQAFKYGVLVLIVRATFLSLRSYPCSFLPYHMGIESQPRSTSTAGFSITIRVASQPYLAMSTASCMCIPKVPLTAGLKELASKHVTRKSDTRYTIEMLVGPQ